MATPNRHNHELTAQRRKDSAYPTNPSRNTFCSTLINQSNQALTRDTNFLGSENPSVFGTSGGGRNEEATGSPEESPQFGTTGNGSLGSKKRKEAPNEAQDEGREAKRTRRNKRVLDRQQERIQVSVLNSDRFGDEYLSTRSCDTACSRSPLPSCSRAQGFVWCHNLNINV